jgi:hypothetical protein
MLLWLGQAAGVAKAKIAEAHRSALAAKPNVSSQSAAIRKVVPWELIETSFNKTRRLAA